MYGNTSREPCRVGGTARRPHFSLAIISVTVQLRLYVFWVISVYFNLRNILPKSGTFLLGHLVYIYIYIYKVKRSQYRPGQALRIPGSWGFQISRQVVRLSAPRTDRIYPREVFLVIIYVRFCVDPTAIARPEGLYQWKIPMTPSGIETATFRLAAQCLHQLCYGVPVYRGRGFDYIYIYIWLAWWPHYILAAIIRVLNELCDPPVGWRWPALVYDVRVIAQ